VKTVFQNTRPTARESTRVRKGLALMRFFLLLELFLELGVGLLKITDVILEQPCFSCQLLLQLVEPMFLVSAPTSACRALCEDRCSFRFLPRCVDPSLGAPGGHSRLPSLSQIFLESVWPHPIYGGRLRRQNNSTKHNGRRAVMPY
jgi:hypothetical protein